LRATGKKVKPVVSVILLKKKKPERYAACSAYLLRLYLVKNDNGSLVQLYRIFLYTYYIISDNQFQAKTLLYKQLKIFF